MLVLSLHYYKSVASKEDHQSINTQLPAADDTVWWRTEDQFEILYLSKYFVVNISQFILHFIN